MPALKLFGRKTLIAGDDVRVLALLMSVVKVAQGSLAIVLLEFASNDLEISESKCDGNFIIFGCNIGFSIALAFIGLCVEISIFIVSGKGTPMNQGPRKLLGLLFHISLTLLHALRLLSFVFGVLAIRILDKLCDCLGDQIDAFGEDNQEICQSYDTWFAVLTTELALQLIDIVYVCMTATYFSFKVARLCRPLSSKSKWRSYFTCFVRCCSLITCCIFGGAKASDSDFTDISLVLANYFTHDPKHENLDITPSDVAAGLLMVRREAKMQHRMHQERIAKHYQDNDVAANDFEPSLRDILSSNDVRDRTIVAEGARFFIYTTASYASFIPICIINPMFCICDVGRRLVSMCFSSNSTREKYIGDNFLQLQRVCLQASLSHVAEKDIIYASFKHDVSALPYFIVFDQEWETVVISIRGTSSFESLVADLSLFPEELTQIGHDCGFNGEERYCHKGMLQCAKWIYEDINE